MAVETRAPRPAPASKGRFSDLRVVLAVAIALLVATVASLTVRTIVGFDIDIAGKVVDARTHKAVLGAHVIGVDVHAVSDSSGAFSAKDVHRGTTLRISADNYRHADVEVTKDPMRVALHPVG